MGAGLAATLLAIAIIAASLYVRGLAPFVPVRPAPLPIPHVSLIYPEGVAIAPDGSIYLSDLLGDRIFKLRPDGKVVVYAGGGSGGDGPALRASLFHPAGIALDGSGNLYIADPPAGTIRKVDVRGQLSTVPIPAGWAKFSGPSGLAVNSSGVLWGSNLLGSVSPISVAGGTIDGASLPAPTWLPGYIAFDIAGNLYIADRAPALGPTPSTLFRLGAAAGSCA